MIKVSSTVMNGLSNDSDTLRLFRERSIVQVKDYDLELSTKIDKTHQRFTKELQVHYKDILKVTDEVGQLFQKLKDGDALFMDLCFKDNFYKLNKLPEVTNMLNKDSHKPSIHSDTSLSQPILIVSNWALAISDFISRFATSSSSAKLFDQVIFEFDELKKELPQVSDYHKVITSKCNNFLQYLLTSPSNMNFSLSQWIRIYNLVLRYKIKEFAWEQPMLDELEQLLFKSIFQEDIDSLLKSNDELISNFVHTETFETKLNEKFLNDINTQFSHLDELLISQKTSDEMNQDIIAYPANLNDASNVQNVVEDSRLYCMGLSKYGRVEMYKIVTPLIELIQELESHGGTSLQIKELRERLISILQEAIVVSPEDQDNTNSNMDDLIAGIIHKHNDVNFNKLLNSQIESLKIQ